MLSANEIAIIPILHFIKIHIELFCKDFDITFGKAYPGGKTEWCYNCIFFKMPKRGLASVFANGQDAGQIDKRSVFFSRTVLEEHAQKGDPILLKNKVILVVAGNAVPFVKDEYKLYFCMLINMMKGCKQIGFGACYNIRPFLMHVF